ncbi:MAG: hypothetical protein QXJ68_04020 [Methanocellales archaeon]
MYEIFAVAATLTALGLYRWHAKVKRSGDSKDNYQQEISDGGENISIPSRLNQVETDPSLSEKEIPEPAIEIEIEQVQAAVEAKPALETWAPREALQAEPMEIKTEPMEIKLEIKTQTSETAQLDPQIAQPQVPTEQLAGLAMPEVKERMISPPIDDEKLRIIDILSNAKAPMRVREIALAYYGKGAYNKRKDSKIRRILAEMIKSGLLVEVNIENSRAFEIKKQ